jgi:hypothetical protein
VFLRNRFETYPFRLKSNGDAALDWHASSTFNCSRLICSFCSQMKIFAKLEILDKLHILFLIFSTFKYKVFKHCCVIYLRHFVTYASKTLPIRYVINSNLTIPKRQKAFSSKKEMNCPEKTRLDFFGSFCSALKKRNCIGFRIPFSYSNIIIAVMWIKWK